MYYVKYASRNYIITSEVTDDYDDGGMSKYPQVEAFFAKHFGNEHGVVEAEQRKQIATETKAKHATVSRWVNGEMRPKAESWNDIAAAAGVAASVVRSSFGASASEVGADVAIRLQTQISELNEIVQELREQVKELTESSAQVTALIAERVEVLEQQGRQRGAQ